jgi:hypothetical protein
LLGFWRDGGGGVRAEELAVVLGKSFSTGNCIVAHALFLDLPSLTVGNKTPAEMMACATPKAHV